MIEKDLKNIAYQYYPKGLSSLEDYEQYIQSKEFLNLSTVINNQLSNKDYKESRKHLLKRFKEFRNIQQIEDVTIEKHDRCLSFEIEIIEGNKLIKICLSISMLIPYYLIYVLKNDIELKPKYIWLNHPKRNPESEIRFESEINLLSKIVEEEMNFNKFPEHLIQAVVPDINYVDIEMGKFTYFNAFFLDNINL